MRLQREGTGVKEFACGVLMQVQSQHPRWFPRAPSGVNPEQSQGVASKPKRTNLRELFENDIQVV